MKYSKFKLWLPVISYFPQYLWRVVIGCWLPVACLFNSSAISHEPFVKNKIKVGAERISEYFELIKDKNIAVVANQTSMVGNVHLVDTLLSIGIKVKKVFAPEHGFRGIADAGEKIKNSRDKKTGLPIVSLYGNNKKPSAENLKDVDIVIFDIQDVGVRFYTYISTLHYVMEACAEYQKKIIVLDRPNPNGFFIDGPVLKRGGESFVGMHPIPLVHGLTIGELALMFNGEGWIKKRIPNRCGTPAPDGTPLSDKYRIFKADITVISCADYSHNDFYELPVKPSPNLPNNRSVYLYPSLGLFEGTIVSVGRGTEKPFQIIGHPSLKNSNYTFMPQSMEGAKDPPYKNEECRGFDLSSLTEQEIRGNKKIYLHWLIGTYQNSDTTKFFLPNNFFNLLTGSDELMQQIKSGWSEKEIRKSWQEDLEKYKVIRKKYLLYDDFCPKKDTQYQD